MLLSTNSIHNHNNGSSLLNFLHPPPPPPKPLPWHLPFSLLSHSSRSPFRLLSLRQIRAQKFDFDSRSYDDDDGDGFSEGDFDGRKRSRRRERRRSKQRRRWWFDERERNELREQEPSVLDQVVDSLWFLKVLRSYGWFSPAILLSILLATGPKAFLMAFSIPLGLSLLILAFKKLSAWVEGTPEPKRRRRTNSPFAKETAFSMEDDEELEDDEEERQPWRKTQKSRYRSWAASNNGPVPKGKSSSKFGGWDELIREEEKERATMPNQKTDEQQTPVQEAMPSMPVRERELPLLLKVLVALFPFLGSWTSLLR